jgi:site-specific DNA recombinase
MTVPESILKAFRGDPTAPGKIVQVGVYTRVSGEKQVNVGGSFSDQKARAPDFVKQIQPNGQIWQIYEYYAEGGISGHTPKRPQLKRLMEDARNGKIDIVLIPMVDRLWRELRLLLNYTHDLKELGIEIISMDGLIDTRHPDYQTSLAIMGLLAEKEWLVRSERAKYAIDRCKKNHEWGKGRPPYGYRFDHSKKTTETNHLIICEDEAGVIRLIFKWYVLENIGGLQIAERLNEMHIAPPPCPVRIKFVGWQTASIFEIIHHHCYKGGYQDGQKEEEVDPECDYRCPAIVDVETWKQAQLICDGKKHIDFAAESKSEFGNGRLRCGKCGQWMRLQENGNGSFSYECVGRLKSAHPDGSPRCLMPRMHWHQTDKAIHEKLNELCTKADMVAEIRKNAEYLKKERTALASKQKPIRQEETRIKKDMDMNVRLAKHHSISPEEFDVEQTRLEAELAALNSSTKAQKDHEETMTLGREIAVLDASIAELEEYAIEIEDPQYDFDVSQGEFHS